MSPWLSGLGISPANTSRVRKGQTPTTDFLSRLQRFEGARIDWLLTGKGTPYLITYCENPAECVEQVELVREEPGWCTYTVTDGERFALVMMLVANWSDDGKAPIGYVASETITVPGGMESPPQVRTEGRYEISRDTMTLLLNGELGSWRLWSADDALLKDEALPADEVREAPTAYAVHTELHQMIDRLPPMQVNALTTLVKALLKAKPEVLASPHTSLHPPKEDEAEQSA